MDDELHTITKPQDMRRRMQEIAAVGAMYDGKADFVGVIVSACLRAGRYEGWSGEDTYTVLAWQLMHAANRYGGQLYETALTSPIAGYVRLHPESKPIESAPKDRAIMLLLPELDGVWARQWWPWKWSYVTGTWSLHLPFAAALNKAAVMPLTDGKPQPEAWTELPPCP